MRPEITGIDPAATRQPIHLDFTAFSASPQAICVTGHLGYGKTLPASEEQSR